MTQRRKKKAARRKMLHGEDVLCDIESIVVILENGKKQRFKIERELAVSDDPEVIHQQAMTAHARYAFWSYQAERSLSRLRLAEVEHAARLGHMRYGYSKHLKEEDRYTSSATIEGMLAQDPDVEAEKKRLIQLREDWTILRAVADALEHRTHLLRRLIAREQDALRG